MKGNQAFIDSQRSVDAASSKRAETILRKSAAARQWYDAILRNCGMNKPIPASQ